MRGYRSALCAPNHDQRGATAICEPRNSPLCESNDLAVAKPGEKITCQRCLKKLTEQGSWANRLLTLGYVFGARPKRKRRGRKADPRQVDFADMLNDGGER